MTIPAKQDNYQVALDHAFQRAQRQSWKALAALGAEQVGSGACRLPVLNSVFLVDFSDRDVTFAMTTSEGVARGHVGIFWQILALHYLSGNGLDAACDRWVAFADFQDIRGYQCVYQGRVIGRFCATVGRNADSFHQAARKNGGVPVAMGDAGYQFQVFPRAPMKVIWYGGDGELPPGVSFLYPDDILSILPLEDVVVLSEGLVGRLQGKGWT